MTVILDLKEEYKGAGRAIVKCSAHTGMKVREKTERQSGNERERRKDSIYATERISRIIPIETLGTASAFALTRP
jgi:hypothetical protein